MGILKKSMGIGALLSAGLMGCGPGVGEAGNLVFADNEFSAFDNPKDQNFAVGDNFEFKTTVANGAGVILDEGFVAQVDKGDLMSVAATFVDGDPIDVDDDSLTLSGSFLAEGSAQLQVLDGATIIDFIEINIAGADTVQVQPVQFDQESGKPLNDNATKILLNGEVPIATKLIDNQVGNLRGQVAGTATSDDDLVVGVIADANLELGQRFNGNLNAGNGIVLTNGLPVSGVSLIGESIGSANVTFTDNAGTFLENITLEVIDPFDANGNSIVDLDIVAPGQDPSAPVASGVILARTVLLQGGEEVFGGSYVFVDVTPGGPLVTFDAASSPISGDRALFVGNGTGVAEIEVSLVDGINGSVITQRIVTINVQ